MKKKGSNGVQCTDWKAEKMASREKSRNLKK